jgi:hypothetical protein
MSPEQVRGKQTDNRSDIFAFGAILYEMLTGIRPFRGDSAIETMNAILKEDPPDITESKPDLSPTLDHVIRRCLEKNPDMRFHSASDLGFALKELSSVSTKSTKLSAAPAEVSKSKWALIAGVAMASFLVAVLLMKFAANKPQASTNSIAAFSFQRLTFRRGNVLHARFAPDGKTVVYGASWEGQPSEIFLVSPGNPESRPLNIQKADLLSINSQGEMAILERRGILQSTTGTGTLAITSLTGGGTPREILDDVYDADWLPDNNFVVMRNINGKNRIEFPIGKTVFETEYGVQAPRSSPSGDRVLFDLYTPQSVSLNLIDLAGNKTTLVDHLVGLDIACWSRDGKSIWFTASMNGRYGIYSIDLQGKIIAFTPLVSYTIVHDISPDGNLLLEQELSQFGNRIQLAEEPKERDLSWLDGSVIKSISADGKWILFGETREGGGKDGSIYVRKSDGSPAIKLGSGQEPLDISPDGKLVLVKMPSAKRITLIPVGPGMPRAITPETWDCKHGVFINQETVGVYCAEPNQKPRLYSLNLNTLKTEPLTPPADLDNGIVSEDGKQVLVSSGRIFHIYPENTTQSPLLSTLGNQDKAFLAWNNNGLFTWNYDEFPPKISRIDSKTGKRELWKEIIPEDPTIIRIDNIAMTKDARSYAYEYVRILYSDLYLMTH